MLNSLPAPLAAASVFSPMLLAAVLPTDDQSLAGVGTNLELHAGKAAVEQVDVVELGLLGDRGDLSQRAPGDHPLQGL